MAANEALNEHQFYKGHARLSKFPVPTQPVDAQRVEDIATSIKSGSKVRPLEVQEGHLFNGNHRYAALKSTGAKTASVVIEGKKPQGMLYTQPISEHEFEDTAGYSHGS